MFTFTENDIRNLATAQSYARGESYYYNGAVSDLTLRGNQLTARVAGSDYEPYRVNVTLSADGRIASATCTCPYDWGGYCKHIVATLLAALHEPEIESRPGLETLLADLTADQLRGLLLTLAAEQPDLIELIEEEVEGLKAQPTPAAPPPASVPYDLAAIRREIRKNFRNVAAAPTRRGYDRDYYWDDEEGLIYPDEILGPHLELARRLLDAGDAAAATEVMETVIEQWIEEIEDLEEWIYDSNQDAIAEAGRELAVLLAEALLSQNLSPEEREDWLEDIEEWDEDVVEVEIVRTALEQWWDYPPLVAVLKGHITEKGAWEGEPPDFADELALARLRILERQGRFQEYLYLAQAEGQLNLYVNMLARIGRVEQAVEEARTCLMSPDEFLHLAQTLAAQGHITAALQVAAFGLEQESRWSCYNLARWTAEQAERAGNAALALRAAETAFLSGYDLEDYKLAQRMAGSRWPEVRERLLKRLESVTDDRAVTVYLYERMLPQAMALIEHNPYSSYLDQVIEATRGDYPDWGIRQYQRRAESIMNAGESGHYDEAASWLRRARDIYLQHQRQAEWTAYLNGLLERHARKYKLVPMLRDLR
ncbi:MAG: SWIM zinc finger family protein [Anaerolineae bacterium]